MTLHEALKSVVATLDTISVSGKSNMDKLLGCILTLEDVCGKIEKVVEENDGNSERENGNG